MADGRFKTVLEPQDEHPHEPDEASNDNESTYLNGSDRDQEVAGWFRLGNRVNEGYAEMSVCLYLPGGRVGFMFGRPKIETNALVAAGGLTVDVVEPFAHPCVAYEGAVVLLDEPADTADPRAAFRDNPHGTCSVRLDIHGISPMYGGRAVRARRRPAAPRPARSRTSSTTRPRPAPAPARGPHHPEGPPPLSGSSAEQAKHLRAYADAGLDELMLPLPVRTPEELLRGLDTSMQEVVPALRCRR